MKSVRSSSTFKSFAARLREFILLNALPDSNGSEKEFNAMALELFALQFASNAPYRKFCEARKAEPGKVNHWPAIPAMPTAGFKELELSCLPPKHRTMVFHSSGTTDQRPSRHFHNGDSISIYEASLETWFRAHFPPRDKAGKDFEGKMTLTGEETFLFLTPSPGHARHSSLVHMFECIRRKYGPADSHFAGQLESDGSWDLDLKAIVGVLREAIGNKRPVTICGTAFNFVHLLDHLDEANLLLQLPPGSRALETGGYKGRSRTLPKVELHALITDLLGIPASHIVCEYGMSELSSQAYDGVTGGRRGEARVFHFPQWVRAQIVSPETGCEVDEGETGLIRIFDLTNVYSVMAIQTEDLGARRGSGFELVGRAALSEPRGCSLMSS